ncbi:MAG: hypothetical protein PHS71_07785 [Proteiniphilum sp.]|jgi:hypothetical protein|nr:hypothetical protein [Proteiniphilum sp.]MDD2513132.1 hypothetical protein [Proteiniphilum sp.]
MKNFYFLSLWLLISLGSCDSETPEAEPHIDLAAESLEFSLEQTEPFVGNVTITGIVKNIGDPYHSSEGQQTLFLIEKPAAGDPVTLISKDFKDLDAGETLEITYQVQKWRSSQEFPPDYILRISFDPDLYIDGNPHNDDANQHNNTLEKEGEEIKQLFN